MKKISLLFLLAQLATAALAVYGDEHLSRPVLDLLHKVAEQHYLPQGLFVTEVVLVDSKQHHNGNWLKKVLLRFGDHWMQIRVRIGPTGELIASDSLRYNW